jgi:hypothetical protein
MPYSELKKKTVFTKIKKPELKAVVNDEPAYGDVTP